MTWRIHSPWLLTLGEIPLPCGPVPGKSVLGGTCEQREPILRRVVGRRRFRVRRGHGFQIQALARRRLHFRRIDESVAADPDVVAPLRQVRHEVPPLVVGDDALDQPGRRIPGFRNHPDASLGPFRSRDDAANVVARRWRLFQSGPDRHAGRSAKPPRVGQTRCAAMRKNKPLLLMRDLLRRMKRRARTVTIGTKR